MTQAALSFQRRRGGMAPALVNIGGAVVVLLLVVTLMLRANQSNPPAVAEFAPQPQHPITQAPQEQSSNVGHGPGGAGAGPPPSPVPSPTIPANADLKHCVGDPPRQTEDPQSPPCVAYWAGNNGGITWHGVTKDTIFIAVPHIETGPAQSGTTIPQGVIDLQNWFNKRYEFYGRKIQLVNYPANNLAPQQMQADAEAIAKLNVFASTPHVEDSGIEYYFMDDLARYGIISTASGWTLQVGEDHLAQHAPYEWVVQPGAHEISAAMGEWICKQLAGKPASSAGAQFAGTTRKFGLVIGTSHYGNDPDLTPLENQLSACHAGIADIETINESGDDASQWHAEATNDIVAMRSKNVTSVIAFVHSVPLLTALMPVASDQAYQPEWLLSSYEGVDDDSLVTVGPRDQTAHAIGISFLNKHLPPAERPINWALAEQDPGQNDSSNGVNNLYVYWPLMILAAGIQMAGPQLTPQTFQAGLFKALYSNPGAGSAPYYQATVDYGPGHAFFTDATAIWVNPAAKSAEASNQTGAWCYALHGARYSLGGWPTEAAFPPSRSYCY